MVRIKICGITRLEDALFSLHSGANAIGFVFAEGSKRLISIDKCKEIFSQLPIFSYTVAVFKNNPYNNVKDILKECCFSALQFHGDEEEDFCTSFGKPYLKAFGIEKNEDLKILDKFKKTQNILLDNKEPGSGKLFNHSILSEIIKEKNVVLAGGLTPENVSNIITNLPVFGVDVSTGVEKSPGIKDDNKIKNFINNIRRQK